MIKSPNYDLVNILVVIVKEFQLIYLLGQTLTDGEKILFKKLLLKNNININSRVLADLIDYM